MNVTKQLDLDALEKSISCSCNPEMIECINELRDAREEIESLKHALANAEESIHYWMYISPLLEED